MPILLVFSLMRNFLSFTFKQVDGRLSHHADPTLHRRDCIYGGMLNKTPTVKGFGTLNF